MSPPSGRNGERGTESGETVMKNIGSTAGLKLMASTFGGGDGRK
jgi:hypothetical protein